jgi:hypothetical protein
MVVLRREGGRVRGRECCEEEWERVRVRMLIMIIYRLSPREREGEGQGGHHDDVI